ncbi:MAG: hypothetical protein ACOC35_16720 [Promethearchaeia archaeon]
MKQIYKASKYSIHGFAEDLQDYFYYQLGAIYRARGKKTLQQRRIRIITHMKCFIGVVPLSKLFSSINEVKRGEISSE